MTFFVILGNCNEKEARSAMAPNSYFSSILGLSDFPHLKQFWLVHATCRATHVLKCWVRISNQRGKTRDVYFTLAISILLTCINYIARYCLPVISIFQNALLSAVPFLCNWILSVLYSSCLDKCMTQNCFAVKIMVRHI